MRASVIIGMVVVILGAGRSRRRLARSTKTDDQHRRVALLLPQTLASHSPGGEGPDHGRGRVGSIDSIEPVHDSEEKARVDHLLASKYKVPANVTASVLNLEPGGLAAQSSWRALYAMSRSWQNGDAC